MAANGALAYYKLTWAFGSGELKKHLDSNKHTVTKLKKLKFQSFYTLLADNDTQFDGSNMF